MPATFLYSAALYYIGNYAPNQLRVQRRIHEERPGNSVAWI